MDINLGRLSTSLRLDISKLSGDMTKAGKSLKDFSTRLKKQMGEDMKDLGKTLSIGLTAPILALGKAAVDSAVKMDSLTRGLTAVTGSSRETAVQLKRLESIGKLPGLSFEEAIQGSISLQAAGISAKVAERALRGFGNALATVGKGNEELKGVVTALTQIQSKGKVYAEEINQLQERLPQIRKAMLAVFGTANTEILQKAGITSAQFISLTTDYFLKQKQVGETAKNTFENFSESLKKSLTELGKAILPDVLKVMGEIEAAVKNLTTWWKGLSAGTKQNIVRFGEIAAIIGPLTFAIGALSGVVETLSKAFGVMRLAVAALSTPLGGVVSLAAVGGLAIVKLINDTNAAIAAGKAAVAKESGKLLSVREQDPAYNLNILRGLKEERKRLERSLASETFSPSLTARRKRELEALNKLIHAREGQAQGNWRTMGPPAPSLEEAARRKMQEDARAQIAAAEKADADKKAAAAKKKADAEARRRQAAIDRREALENRVLGKTGQFARSAFDTSLQELIDEARVEEQNKRILAEMTKAERGATFTSKMQEQAEALGARWALAEEKGKAKFRQGVGRASSFLGGASGAFSDALGSLSPMAQRAAEETAKRRIQLEDRVAAHSVQMGQMALSRYQEYLQKRLLDSRENIEEQMRIETELADVTFRLQEQQERKRFQGWQNLARGLEGVFSNAFENVLNGSKDFFQSLLDGFKQMLAQMLAQAIAVGLIRSLFGGGNFLTGFTSVFGFDDAGNDAMARRWARDFAYHAGGGARDYQRASSQGRMAASGGGAVNVQVSFGAVTVHSPMDAQQVGEQIAWATKNALRRRV